MSKKFVFLVITLGLLGFLIFVDAMMKSTVCQSEAEIEKQIFECKKQGLDYRIVYDENQCKIVKCIKLMTPMLYVPQISEDFDGDGIVNSNDACPKEPEVYNGFKDDDGCPDKLDEVKKCLPLEEVEKGILVCKTQGLDYEYVKDEDGCSLIKCVVSTPSCSSIEPEIKKCKDQNLSYSIYIDEKGCKKVKCEGSEKIINCKKIIEGSCVRIKCDDGYFFDSCTYQSQCRVECKTFTDNEGCFIKICSDGSEQRECPKKEIKCEVFKTDDGCEKKICTDGFVAIHCPPKEECKIYEDESGCKVKECPDGSKIRDCPILLKEKELECKVFTDERNCKIKICSNGLKIDYCAEPSCKVEVDSENCRIKKCDNGYVSRECPNKELIECQVIIEKETNCTIKKCSNGYEEKTCPEEKSPVSFVPEISPQKTEGGGVFNAIKSFFRRLFFR